MMQFYNRASPTFSVSKPYDLPCLQRDFLERHLTFSCALNELTKTGDAIIRNLYKCKKKKRGFKDYDAFYIIRQLRRYMNFEMLRSSLEGLLFEQVPSLNEPDSVYFEIDGIYYPLLMQHVYFSRQYWDFRVYERDISFDLNEYMSESDILIILSFLNNQESLFYVIQGFVDAYNGQDRLMWKQRLYRNIRSIMNITNHVKTRLLARLDRMLEED